MDVANLEGEALLACVEAARFWEPEGAAKFATFAQAYVQKRLRGMAADQKKEAAALRQANWDLIPDELDDDETEITEPTEEQEAILGALAEPMRTAVRQIVFEGLTPARVAAQMGVEVKDLKLSIRNAATALRRAKAHMSAPNLFAESV
jgi:DNA-directed RNA polymerase specialized sigma24 family protein